jgi:ABC-type branched-subunit amino acid transport system permease subunit
LLVIIIVIAVVVILTRVVTHRAVRSRFGGILNRRRGF